MPETFEDLVEKIYNTKLLPQLRVCMPAKVEKYDKKTHLATVQPLLKRKFFGRQKAELLPSVARVPIIHPRSDTAIVKVPISKGSIVTLVFADRSIENWISGNGDPREPGDTRKHHLNDAYAIPGGYPIQRPWETAYPDALEMVVKKGTKIAIGNDTVELLNLAHDAFSSLKDLADELSQLLTDIQLETHSTTSPGAPTGVPLNAASYATTKTAVDNISSAVDSIITDLGEIKP